jgi:hypothetical protein
MVTPHILRENAVPYFANPALSSMNAGVPGNLNDGNIKPIGLPRYMGEYSAVANQAIAEPELPSVSPSSRSPLRQLFGGRPKSPPTMAPMTAPPPRQRIQPETIKPIESP